MPYISIDDFKLGMDTRKPRVTGIPGSLSELKNGHITRGGHVQRMKKFVSTYTLPQTTASVKAQVIFKLQAGTDGSITSIKIGVVELLTNAVAFDTSLTVTAAAVVTEINANTVLRLGHGYTATSSSQRITIIAPTGSGIDQNGKVVTVTVTGTLVATGDAYWEDTIFHADFNGTDAAIAFVEESASGVDSPHALTFLGTAQLDTAQKKYGTASLMLDGNSDVINSVDSDDWDFGFGDFTIEADVRFAAISTGLQMIASQYGTADADRAWQFYYDADADTLEFIYIENGSAIETFTTTALSLVIDTWYHVAVDRDASNNLRMYLNGVKKSDDAAAAS